MNSGLGCQLALGTVLVKSCHRKELLSRNSGRIIHCNQTIGVARVSNHQSANTRSCVSRYRLPLTGENLTIYSKKVISFHTGFAGNRTNQKSPISAAKTLGKITSRHNLVEKRERAVIKLHHSALKRSHGRLNLDQTKINRLIRPEHRTRGNASEKGVADLTSGTCNRDSNWSFHRHPCLLSPSHLVNGCRVEFFTKAK